MTDKQIIIDGVDVSGCKESRYYDNTYHCDLHHTKKTCKDFPNCYYKQLKRKEQECKLLKSALKNQNIVAIVEENDQLKAENEKLKSVSMQKCPQCGEVYLNPVGVEILEENEALKIGNEKLKEKLKAYIEDRFCQGGCAIYQYDKIHRLKQALDEIKEYCILQQRNMNLNPNRLIEEYILDIISKAKEQEC